MEIDDKQNPNQSPQMCPNDGDFKIVEDIKDNKATALVAVDDPRLVPAIHHVAVTDPPEIPVSREDFEALKILGTGGYGKVFLVRKKTGSYTGAVFAMKVLKKSRVFEKSDTLHHVLSERKILEKIKSPFFCELFFACHDEKKLYFFMEYAPGGELFFLLKQRGRLQEDQAKFYLVEILIAVEHLHLQGVIYRDLKSENVLLDKNGHIKLADFGFSKEGMSNNARTSTLCGSLEFMAPEIIKGWKYGLVADWWSLGIVFYDMVDIKTPFHGQTKSETVQNILTQPVVPPAKLSREAQDLMMKLLTKSRRSRLGAVNGAEEIKNHNFFHDIDWEKAYAREMIPPFPPVGDLAYFDPKVTSQSPVESFCEAVANPREDDPFEGFSYSAPPKSTIGSVLPSSSTEQGPSSSGTSSSNANRHSSHRLQEDDPFRGFSHAPSATNGNFLAPPLTGQGPSTSGTSTTNGSNSSHRHNY